MCKYIACALLALAGCKLPWASSDNSNPVAAYVAQLASGTLRFPTHLAVGDHGAPIQTAEPVNSEQPPVATQALVTVVIRVDGNSSGRQP